MDRSHMLLKPEAQVAQGASCSRSWGLKAVPAPPSLDGDTEVPREDLNWSRAVQLQTSVSVISEPKPVCCAAEADRDLPRGTAPCPLSTRHPGGAECLEMHRKQSSTRKGRLLAHPCSGYSNLGRARPKEAHSGPHRRSLKNAEGKVATGGLLGGGDKGAWLG